MRRAIGIRVATGRDDVATARVRITLGAVLLDQGRVEEARTELARALAFLEKSVPAHPAIATARADSAAPPQPQPTSLDTRPHAGTSTVSR